MARLRPLLTTWGEELQNHPEQIPLPEYPRPSMVRRNWRCLNGYWDYAIRGAGKETGAAQYSQYVESYGEGDGQIRVPFSPECTLSGVNRQLLPGERLWYRRTLFCNERTVGGYVLLHFGAVDQIADVWINGQYAGGHVGGYLPFTLSVEELLTEGENELVVCVQDDSDTVTHARGKQKLHPGGMFYTATSGIWQSVWLEEVPAAYIEGYETKWEPETGTLWLLVKAAGAELRRNHETEGNTRAQESSDDSEMMAGQKPLESAKAYRQQEVLIQLREPSCRAEEYIRTPEDAVRLRRKVLQEFTAEAGKWTPVKVDEPQLWTQDTPWLYGITVTLGEDEIDGYLALCSYRSKSCMGSEREQRRETGEDCSLSQADLDESDSCSETKRQGRLLQNGQPHFQRGVLDQGYWSDGLYTAPSDEALIYDITEMKALGFNMLRKHIKIGPERWYYHCDRLGMAVWQDMVCGGGPYRAWFVTYGATLLHQLLIHVSDDHPWLFSRRDAAGKTFFEQEMLETQEHLGNHPCICTWVIFNEGWGQFDTKRLTKRLQEAMASHSDRLIDAASGWFDQRCGDYQSVHHYYLRFVYHKKDPRMRMLSEFGGLPFGVEGHLAAEKVYGYGSVKDQKDLNQRFQEMIRWAESLEDEGFIGYVYTQVSDVEEEINGIFTFDRRVKKITSTVIS